MTSLYAPANFRPVAYRAEAGEFEAPPLGWILHVVVGNGSPFGTFENAKSPYRRFSHFWVSKSGQVEQYQPTNLKSWAQGTGNGLYYSIETEGFPSESLTAAQINQLAMLHIWLRSPDKLANSVGESGIGVHYMGGADWGGHSCPDPQRAEGKGPRSRQRSAILARVAELRTPPETIHGPLGLGDRGDSVRTVQRHTGAPVDGIFGPVTLAAVQSFQRAHKLAADGVVGPLTARAMGCRYVT